LRERVALRHADHAPVLDPVDKWDRTARLWDADTSMEAAVLRGHTREVWSAAFSLDGKRVVTAPADNTARLWNAKVWCLGVV
jgi:WD40 repeat protein